MLDIRRRTGMLFLAITMAQVLLISAQVRSKSGVAVLEVAAFGVFSRVQGAVAAGLRGLQNVWGGYVDLRGVRAENERLRREVTDLRVRLLEQRALADRTVRLQQLLELKAGSSLPLLAAQVIAGNPNPGMRTVTIDRGASDGVQADMAVVGSTGVIGRVIGRPAAHAAIVQLLVDRTAAAGAVTERTRAGGVVVGVEGEPPLAMELVSNLADVQPGDTVVASGVDGIYPRGFPIGQVQTVQRGAAFYSTITVRPAVNFSNIDDVLVVLVPGRGATAEAALEAAAGPPR